MQSNGLNDASNNGHLNINNNGSHQPNMNDSDDEIDLKKIFNLLFGYKWLFITIVMISTVGSYYFAKSLTPIYQGDGTMIISESRNSYSMAGSDLNSLLSSSFGIGRGSTISNELEVLRSRSLAKKLGDHLVDNPKQEDGTMFPVLWREYPIDSTLISEDTLISRIRTNLTIGQVDRETDVVRVNYDSPSPFEASYITNLVLDTYNQHSIDQNRAQTRSALEFLNTEMNTVKNTLANKEELLRDFMNKEKLVQLDRQTEELITAMSQLEIERQEVTVKSVAVNSAIESYQNELDKIKPGFAKMYAEGMSPKLNRFQYELAELETRKMLMIQKNPNLRDNPLAEPELVKLNNQIDRLRSEITQLAGDFIESDEKSLSFLGSADGSLSGRVNEMRQELILLEIEAQQYQAQADVLDIRLAEYQVFFDDLPDNMVDFARIKRDIQINEQLFLTISTQTAELSVWEQTQASMGRVVDYSIIPLKPISPRTKLIVLIGFVLGGMFSIGLVFLREISITQINSVDKLKQRGYPLLSVIPDVSILKKKLFNDKKWVDAGDVLISTDLLTVLDSMSYASEAYRRLVSNIFYSQPDKPYKTILVTSPNKSEGKSSVISNLAVAIAESGKKVVIIDCDFRRPRQHKVWGLSSSPGVVDVLFDKTRFERVIQPTLIENLEIITGGMRPPNPAAIIQSQRMKQLVEDLKEIYDVVLIDCPPFGIITDAAPLIQLADGVILASRFNQTKEAELDQCIENLRNVKATIIGTVLNAYDYKKATNQYNANHYKYAYESYARYHETEEK
ncbi:MAG: polysaccharide biosynthesis tyrosine autokinase [Balneolales bacterium]